VHYDINFIPVTNLIHKILYSYNVTVLYMFRAVLCSSSGGQIVRVRHMVSSHSMSGRGGGSVLTCVLYDHHGHSQRVTISYAVYIQFDLLRMSIILLETCRGLVTLHE
jgi:hypothetical protein